MKLPFAFIMMWIRIKREIFFRNSLVESKFSYSYCELSRFYVFSCKFFLPRLLLPYFCVFCLILIWPSPQPQHQHFNTHEHEHVPTLHNAYPIPQVYILLDFIQLKLLYHHYDFKMRRSCQVRWKSVLNFTWNSRISRKTAKRGRKKIMKDSFCSTSNCKHARHPTWEVLLFSWTDWIADGMNDVRHTYHKIIPDSDYDIRGSFEYLPRWKVRAIKDHAVSQYNVDFQ